MTGAVFSGIIFGICSLVMFGIGISQLKSKEPVGFYRQILYKRIRKSLIFDIVLHHPEKLPDHIVYPHRH